MCNVDNADESVTVLSDTRPRARKPHRCDECARTIEPGEAYRRHSFVFEGRVGCSKCCTHCEVARAWLRDECGGWIYGGVLEDIAEHVHDHGYGPDLEALLAHMRSQWRGPDGSLLAVPDVPAGWQEAA